MKKNIDKIGSIAFDLKEAIDDLIHEIKLIQHQQEAFDERIKKIEAKK